MMRSILLFAIFSLLLSGCQAFPVADPQTGLVFQDDFSDPISGWTVVDHEIGRAGYEGGLYKLWVKAPLAHLPASLPEKYRFPADVQVGVDVRKASGPDDNRYGVLCRYVDEANYYWLAISSDGYYGIGKVKDGVTSLIGMEQMIPSELIAQGDAWNHLQVECIGDRLRIAVNGLLLAEQQDGDFTGGRVGLFAGADLHADLIVEFDQFTTRLGTP